MCAIYHLAIMIIISTFSIQLLLRVRQKNLPIVKRTIYLTTIIILQNPKKSTKTASLICLKCQIAVNNAQIILQQIVHTATKQVSK